MKDLIELLEDKMDRLTDKHMDENTCMQCGKKVNYELICPHPMGYGPLVCEDCLGFSRNQD